MKRLLTGILLILMLFCTGCKKEPEPKTEPENQTPKEGLQIHVISLGKADAILVLADGEAMLIDAGLPGQGGIVTEYLKAQGVAKLKYLVLTHGDKDHIGGAPEVIRAFPVEQAYLSPKKEKSAEYSAMSQALNDAKVKYSFPAVLSSFTLGRCTFTVLAPGEKALDAGDDNNSSLVLRLTYGERTALFMGDALSKSEKEMRENGYELKAEIIKVGHHGKDDATTKKFIREVAPQYAIITCSAEDPAEEDAINVLKAFAVEILRTDERGTIVLSTDGTKWEVKSER